MAMEYAEEQLNKLDKTALVQLFLMQQAQLKDIDHKLQLLLEQVAAKRRKGCSPLLRQSRHIGARGNLPVRR